MAQQHGLGRGLSSLIPPKKTGGDSPFKDMVLRAVEKESFPVSGVIKPLSAEISKPVVSSGASFSGEPESEVSPVSILMNSVVEADIMSIVPNPHQPRIRFDEEKLRELANSIQEHGILQPLIVSPLPDGKYELIAGERRLQAAKLAGLATVPVLVRDAKENEKLELAIIENVQRHDLDPIEEAKAYARLMDEFGLTQEGTAKKMGKSRSAVANLLRLLSLPIEIQRAISEGKITEGHAKALLSIENPEKQRALFEMIVKTGMTVRETESKAREVSVRPHVRHISTLPPELAEKADRLSSALGTKVAVKPAGKGGRIVVEYYSDEELEQIVSRFLVTN
ncbi:MAG: ParB/RepB/Spo0J family partition protein [Candidatus Moranbacteria bacterium]|nr:ParB/RepB/Spo0J family partition protein [Candidatus Moranbacteria bacterium]